MIEYNKYYFESPRPEDIIKRIILNPSIPEDILTSIIFESVNTGGYFNKFYFESLRIITSIILNHQELYKYYFEFVNTGGYFNNYYF